MRIRKHRSGKPGGSTNRIPHPCSKGNIIWPRHMAPVRPIYQTSYSKQRIRQVHAHAKITSAMCTYDAHRAAAPWPPRQTFFLLPPRATTPAVVLQATAHVSRPGSLCCMNLLGTTTLADYDYLHATLADSLSITWLSSLLCLPGIWFFTCHPG